MVVKLIPVGANGAGAMAGKVADAELHFTDGPLAGLKLLGFAVWARRNGGGFNVTYPSRTYSVNGERRSFSLLRPVGDASASNGVRDLILAAWADFEAAAVPVPADVPRADLRAAASALGARY